VAGILNDAYPNGVEPPINIDLLVERHESVDAIIAADLEQFGVDAVLVCKADTRTFDIFFDENSVRGRISFSIAHEFGHAVLHRELCLDCRTIEDVLTMRSRLVNHYTAIEADAQYFASAILMPRRCLQRDTAIVYGRLVQEHGLDGPLIQSKVCPTLANRYQVTVPAMKIRMDRLGLQRQVTQSLIGRFTTLDIQF
jgi:Zn-dependent peptidase ImmA (M78 family)